MRAVNLRACGNQHAVVLHNIRSHARTERFAFLAVRCRNSIQQANANEGSLPSSFAPSGAGCTMSPSGSFMYAR